MSVSQENMRVCGHVIFTLCDLRKNEKVRETVFVCSYGGRVESFQQKNWWKISASRFFW